MNRLGERWAVGRGHGSENVGISRKQWGWNICCPCSSSSNSSSTTTSIGLECREPRGQLRLHRRGGWSALRRGGMEACWDQYRAGILGGKGWRCLHLGNGTERGRISVVSMGRVVVEGVTRVVVLLLLLVLMIHRLVSHLTILCLLCMLWG